MEDHRTAITVRAAPSFLRVGQVECFSRRARDNLENGEEQLRLILEQVFRREYPHLAESDSPFPEKLLQLLKEFSTKQAVLTSQWIRVGFAQGNYNSDNCLLNGRTMDYGPFGFMEAYDPAWAAWTGSGSHFAFRNQPMAGYMNLKSLSQALTHFLNEDQQAQAKAVVKNYIEEVSPVHMHNMYAGKLGLENPEVAFALFRELEQLLAGGDSANSEPVDYIILFRQLCSFQRSHLDVDDNARLAIIQNAFYGEFDIDKWAAWLRGYVKAINEQSLSDEDRQQRMRSVNPKYVPREWMLVEAYQLAEQLDFSLVHELLTLFQNPYEEQPDFEAKYYRKTPEHYQHKGGVTFMS